MEYNWIRICLSKDYDLISLLSWDVDGWGGSINANRNELTARISGRETGEGRGANAPCNVKEPEMPTIYFHSIQCWCSLFSLPKARHSLTNVVASTLNISVLLRFATHDQKISNCWPQKSFQRMIHQTERFVWCISFVFKPWQQLKKVRSDFW